VDAYWINQGQPNDYLWAHEVDPFEMWQRFKINSLDRQFSKHATCTSTFDIACYGPDYKQHQDVINYFDAVIRAFHYFPTYDMLAA
jgi:ribonuclease T2